MPATPALRASLNRDPQTTTKRSFQAVLKALKTRTFPSVAGFLLCQAASLGNMTYQHFVGIFIGICEKHQMPTKKYQHWG